MAKTTRSVKGRTGPRRKTLVFVDDEAPVLEALKRALRNEPYDVLTTEWPQQALNWVSNKRVSLILCDHRMADMSGLHLLEEVAKRSPATKRLILTGYRSAELIIDCLKQGIVRVVYKPWNDEALQRILRKELTEAPAAPTGS